MSLIDKFVKCILFTCFLCSLSSVNCDTRGWYKEQIGIVTSSVITTDNVLIVGTIQGIVAAIDTVNGDIIWRNTSEDGRYVEDLKLISSDMYVFVKRSKYEKKLDAFSELDSVSILGVRDGHLFYNVENSLLVDEQINKVFSLDDIQETDKADLVKIDSDVLLLDSTVSSSRDSKHDGAWLILLSNSYLKMVNLNDWSTHVYRLDLKESYDSITHDGNILSFNIVLMDNTNFYGFLAIKFSLNSFKFNQFLVSKPFSNKKALKCLECKASNTAFAQLYESDTGHIIMVHWIDNARVYKKEVVFDLVDPKFGDGFGFYFHITGNDGYQTFVVNEDTNEIFDGKLVHSKIDDLFIMKDSMHIYFRKSNNTPVNSNVLMLSGNVNKMSVLMEANVYEIKNDKYHLLSFSDGILHLYKNSELQWERDESLSLVISSLSSSYNNSKNYQKSNESENLFKIYIFDVEELIYFWNVFLERLIKFFNVFRLFLINKVNFEKYKIPLLNDFAQVLSRTIGPDVEDFTKHEHRKFKDWKKKTISDHISSNAHRIYVTPLRSPFNKSQNKSNNHTYFFRENSLDTVSSEGNDKKEMPGTYLLLMTNIGKLLCLNEDGVILWRHLVTDLKENFLMDNNSLLKCNCNGKNGYGYLLETSVTRRMVQRPVLMYGNGRRCNIHKVSKELVVSICSDINDTSYIKWFNIMSGTLVHEKIVKFTVKYSMPLWNEYNDVMSGFVLLANNDVVQILGIDEIINHSIGEFLETKEVVVVTAKEKNKYQGLRVLYDCINKSYYYKHLWTINFSINMDVIALGVPEHKNRDTSSVIVMSDLNVYQKYLTPHSLVLLTRHHDGVVMLHLVNTLSGNIIYEELLDPDLSDPIHIAFHDNTIDVYYWNARQVRYLLHSVDLIYNRRLGMFNTLLNYFKSGGKGATVDVNMQTIPNVTSSHYIYRLLSFFNWSTKYNNSKEYIRNPADEYKDCMEHPEFKLEPCKNDCHSTNSDEIVGNSETNSDPMSKFPLDKALKTTANVSEDKSFYVTDDENTLNTLLTPDVLMPVPLVRDFVLPYEVRIMGVSITNEGTTDKSLLFVTFDHQIVSIPKSDLLVKNYERGGFSDNNQLDYRIGNRYFTMNMEESFHKINYINKYKNEFVQHGFKNVNTRGIMSMSTVLESTTMVLYYGLDLTLLHVYPLGIYDDTSNLHNLHYMYVLILMLLVILTFKAYNNYIKSYIDHYECY